MYTNRHSWWASWLLLHALPVGEELWNVWLKTKIDCQLNIFIISCFNIVSLQYHSDHFQEKMIQNFQMKNLNWCKERTFSLRPRSWKPNCKNNSLPSDIFWRRKWQPTPVSLPRKSHGHRSLVGCSPWSHRVGTTEWLTLTWSWAILIQVPHFSHHHLCISPPHKDSKILFSTMKTIYWICSSELHRTYHSPNPFRNHWSQCFKRQFYYTSALTSS